MATLPRRLLAEAIGTALLLATIVGSGIMATRLADGNAAFALLANAAATGAMLVVLILVFASVSGAHLNPAVSLALALRGDFRWREVAPYAAAQLAGAVAGVLAAHLMFDLPVLQAATTPRSGPGQWLSEFIATLGLLLVVFGCARRATATAAAAVGLYIVAAYWFTASTAFANPAVTVARALSDSFAGIAPADVPGFVLAQLAGMLAAVGLQSALWPRPLPHGSGSSPPP